MDAAAITIDGLEDNSFPNLSEIATNKPTMHPMNITKIKKSGESCSFLDNSVNWKTKINIKDGEYKVGIRPHNITTYREGNNSLEIKGKVLISELSGSESLIHFTRGNLNWVSLSNGVFQKNVGDEMNLYMNADEFIYFDENERLVING